MNNLVKEWNKRASVLNNRQIKEVYYEKDEYTDKYGNIKELSCLPRL